MSQRQLTPQRPLQPRQAVAPVQTAQPMMPSLPKLAVQGATGRVSNVSNKTLSPQPFTKVVNTPQSKVQNIAVRPAPPVQAAPAPAPAVRRYPAIDMDLPGEESPERLSTVLFSSKWHKARTWAFRGTAAAMILMITLGGLLFSQGYLKAHKVFRGSAGTAAALKADVKPELLKGEGSGRINILLLGRGGGTHDAPDLTDTMMVISVDPVNNTSTIISVPRDLWVSVPGGGAMKINAAWQTGMHNYVGKAVDNTTNPKAIEAGYKTVDQTVEQVLGININYNVLVDFDAFKQAIDTVGGVQVNVPSDLVDPTMAWENANDPTLAHAGLQTMNGNKALIYARSRETSSDFARSQRQRAIMLALKNKVETAGTLSNPSKINGLVNAFGDNVSTDLSVSNASRLFSILKKVSDSKTTSLGLGDEQNQIVTTGNLNGQSIVLPKAGLFNFSDIQNFIHAQVKDPYIAREHAKVLVLNGTTTPGLASQTGDSLKSYGYNVSGTANTPNSGWTQTTLVDLTHKNKYTKNYLEQRFKVSASDTLGDQTIPTNGADFVIIIGSDAAQPTTTQTGSTPSH